MKTHTQKKKINKKNKQTKKQEEEDEEEEEGGGEERERERERERETQWIVNQRESKFLRGLEISTRFCYHLPRPAHTKKKKRKKKKKKKAECLNVRLAQSIDWMLLSLLQLAFVAVGIMLWKHWQVNEKPFCDIDPKTIRTSVADSHTQGKKKKKKKKNVGILRIQSFNTSYARWNFIELFFFFFFFFLLTTPVVPILCIQLI